MDFNIIKTCCFDVDGVLTDGSYAVSSEGIITKRFHTRDFYALQLLQSIGIDVVIITQSHDDCIRKQVDRLLPEVKQNILLLTCVSDKKEMIEKIVLTNDLSWKNIAYMGDAENDLMCMELAGITGCPVDAIDVIKEQSHFISKSNGGNGCVYDFVQYILKDKTKEIK